MSRLSDRLSTLKAAGEGAFVPFLVIGDPDLPTSQSLVDALEPHADILEFGLAFSDPPADGPVIQAADKRALTAGVTTEDAFRFLAAVRARTEVPIALLIYYNLILNQGVDRFYARAAEAGVDAILVADLPIEEADEALAAADRHGIAPVFIVSELTTRARLTAIAARSRGYLYLVARLGVTGERTAGPDHPGLAATISQIREATDLPILAGFGLSLPEHVRAVRAAGADGAILGERRGPARRAEPRRSHPHASRAGRAGPQHEGRDERKRLMLILMKNGATEEDIARVTEAIEAMGYEARAIPGQQRTAIGLVGNDRRVDSSTLEGLPGVLEIIHVSAPYKLVSREWKPSNTIIRLENGTEIGGNRVVMMGGPCSVEHEEQIMTAAQHVKAAGATVLRGGAFKPRTSPYAFQGLEREGLELLAKASKTYQLAVTTEAIDQASVDLIAEYADIIQIGARNMANYALLRYVGKLKKPVLLKRGMSATLQELLLAAEYILAGGNDQVILCERGIRGFDNMTRNVFDVSAVPILKSLSHLPVIADPSHGTGRRDQVTVMARAAIAAGADGLIVEMHPQPERALSDGAQSLYPKQFQDMVDQVRRVAAAIDRAL